MMILGRPELSLKDLYYLRGICRTIGRTSSVAFVDRVRRTLVVDKDLFVFSRFLDQVRGSEDELVRAGTPIEAPCLGPTSVGCLLKRVGVSPDSVIVDNLFRIYSNFRDADLSIYARILKAMEPTVGDVRAVIHHLHYTRLTDLTDLNQDDGRENLASFIELFFFDAHQVEELCLSLVGVPFELQLYLIAASQEERLSTMSPIEFRENLWPRIWGLILDHAKGNEELMKDCMNHFLFPQPPRLMAEALLPIPGCPQQTIVELFHELLLESDWGLPTLEVLRCYLTPGSQLNSEPAPSRTVSGPESENFFEALARTEPYFFGRLIGSCMESNRWPVHVDPLHLDLGLSEIDLAEFTSGVSRFLQDEQRQRIGKATLRRFVRANLMHYREKWARELKKQKRQDPYFWDSHHDLERLLRLLQA